MESISQNKDYSFFIWEELIEDYLNNENKNLKATTLRDLEFRLYRFQYVLNKNQFQEKVILYFKDFMNYILFIFAWVQKNLEMLKIVELLKWDLEEKDNPDRWFPHDTTTH